MKLSTPFSDETQPQHSTRASHDGWKQENTQARLLIEYKYITCLLDLEIARQTECAYSVTEEAPKHISKHIICTDI